MSPATRIDPYLAGNFLVEIDGVTTASFTEVSGLEASIDVIDYRNGDSKLDSVQKLPGLNKFTNVTLKRGMVQVCPCGLGCKLASTVPCSERASPSSCSTVPTIQSGDGT